MRIKTTYPSSRCAVDERPIAEREPGVCYFLFQMSFWEQHLNDGMIFSIIVHLFFNKSSG